MIPFTPLCFVIRRKRSIKKMIDSNKVFMVTNRSAGRVFYSVPDLGVKAREFQPGETKRLPYGELEGLSQLPGGMIIIRDYL